MDESSDDGSEAPRFPPEVVAKAEQLEKDRWNGVESALLEDKDAVIAAISEPSQMPPMASTGA